MTLKFVTSIFLAGALAGCSTTWHNTHISDPAIRTKQLAIDKGYCTRVAIGAAPMPEIRSYPPMQQNFAINGRITTWGTNGSETSFYSSTATPATSGFSDGFSSGLQQGVALGAVMRANRERDTIIKGCMFNLGWSDTPASREMTPTQEPARNPLTPNTIPTATSSNNGSPQKKRQGKTAEVGCDEWTNDIAISIDSAYRNGIERKAVGSIASDYLSKVGASGRDQLIFMHIINTRYSIPLKELSSEDFPHYVRWECEQDWTGIGLGRSSK